MDVTVLNGKQIPSMNGNSDAGPQAANTDPVALARYAIGSLLDGKSPNGTTPSQLGKYGELYAEMCRAYSGFGLDAVRRVYAMYAERDPSVAALRAGDPVPARQVWSVSDLLSTDFPEQKWAIPGILPTGLVLLAGRPKLGKSWLALQIASAVGSGGVALGETVELGNVLYLALEDGPRRMKKRLLKQLAPKKTLVDFRFEWKPLADGGTQDMITVLDKTPYTMIVIDTISRALGRADQMDLADMNMAMGALQRIAIERDITILLVDHHRKSAGNGETEGDPIDDVMGSTGKAGVADAALGLYRKRGQKDATLKLTGRDVEEGEFSISFDPEIATWQMVGKSAAVKLESVQADILTAIDESGGEATAAQIGKWLGKLPNNISRELAELCAKNLVVRGDKNGKSVPYRRFNPNPYPEPKNTLVY